MTENSHGNNVDNDSDTDFPSVEKVFSFMKQKAISTETYSSSDRTFGIVDTQTLGDSLTESSESRLGNIGVSISIPMIAYRFLTHSA